MISESVLLIERDIASLEICLESQSSQNRFQDSDLVEKRKRGLRKHVHSITECILVTFLPQAISHGIMQTGAQTMVLKDRFLFRIVLVAAEIILGSAGWLEDVVTVDMGVVVVD